MALKINIELPVLLLFFATTFSAIVTKNFIIYSTCYVTLKQNESECALLGLDYSDNKTKDLENMVQPYATKIFTIIYIIEAIFAPMMCFFFGPWSSKYGRKPVLLLTLGGMSVSAALKVMVSAIPNTSPWFILLTILPSCLTGGIPSAVTAILCYITDVTTEQERPIKMYFFEGLLGVGSIIGNLVCAQALLVLNYFGIFGISTVCIMVAWIYTLFFLPESVQNVQTQGRIRNLFSSSTLIETVKTIGKKRDNYERGLLIAIFILLTICVFIFFGESDILFLFLRQRFAWTIQKYTLFSTITGVIAIFGGIFSVCVLYKLLRFKETTIIILSILICMVGTLFQSVAVKDWGIYVGGSIKLLSGAVSPMARSFLSKIVPVQDIGRVFSVLIALETAGGILGMVVYTALYKFTIHVFPSAFFFLTIGVDVIAVAILSVIVILQRYSSQITYTNIEKGT